MPHADPRQGRNCQANLSRSPHNCAPGLLRTWKAVASDSRELEDDLLAEPQGEAPPLLDAPVVGVADWSSPASSISTLPMPRARDATASPEPGLPLRRTPHSRSQRQDPETDC